MWYLVTHLSLSLLHPTRLPSHSPFHQADEATSRRLMAKGAALGGGGGGAPGGRARLSHTEAFHTT